MNTTTTTITYAVGDLVNGDYFTTKSIEKALQVYTDDAATCAEVAFETRSDTEGREDWDLEDFLSESKDFHYITKITTIVTTDEDGDEETEEHRETIEGGTLDLNA